MQESFIPVRLTELRLKKGVSEYKMSTDIGHSKSYIQSISSGRALPSLTEFLYICEYLGIAPADFFHEDIADPMLIRRINSLLSKLGDGDLKLVLNVAERLAEQTSGQAE